MISSHKIVFVVPPIQSNRIWGALSEGGSILPPSGISILASIARGRGLETKIMDFLAEGESLENAAKRIIDEKPQYVGITATTEIFYFAAQLSRAIKKMDNNITILLGGPHISGIPIMTMEEFDCFDIGFIGESEETLVNFLEVYEGGGDITEVKGLIIRRDGRTLYTGMQSPILDMDRIPFPAWDLLPDIRRYYKPAVTNYKRKPAASLVTSRGCAGKCIFCDSSVFGKRMRAHSAGYVINMIDRLVKEYGIKEVSFYDDSFVSFKERLFKICEIIIDKKIDITWSCEARVNSVEPGMLKLMKRAGCWQISYGIESGSQRILDILKKGIKVDDARRAVEYTKDAGISPRGYFMIANPGETKADIDKTRQFMLDIGLDDVFVAYFTPYPGTETYKKPEDRGVFKSDWKGMNAFSISFIPHGLTEDYLKKQFKYFYRKFYLRPRIIFNYIRRFGSPKDIASLFMKFIKFLYQKEAL